MDRKIILETRVGSFLYGTNRPDSDEDFQGVFIPSRNDLLGVQNCSAEWSLSTKLSTTVQNTKGDVDRKFYNIKRFFHLAAEGQPGQLELFFAPKEMVISFDPIWSQILDNVGLFLARKNVVPFIGFSLSQAHKSTMKGETLNLLQSIIKWYDGEDPKSFTRASSTLIRDVDTIKEENRLLLFGLFDLKKVTNLQGFTTVEIGGRNYDVGLKLKVFINNLKELEARYGSRSRNAAEKGLDYKSLMHAYRLLSEAEELLKYGKITLPRPPKEVEFLLAVRNGTCGDVDHWNELTSKIDNLRQNVEPKSWLPDEPDYAKVNELCVDILSQELRK